MGIHTAVNKKILIRADGNSEIGMGHIMRTMTIATELKKRGCDCCYLCSEPVKEVLFSANGFELITLKYPYREKSLTEAEEICRYINRFKADFIIVDSYYAGNEYLKKLRGEARVICINSTRKKLETDYLINENIACDRPGLETLYHGSGTRLMLGEAYSMIREEFLHQDYQINDQVKKVMITTGGGDQYNFMTQFTARIQPHEENGIRYVFVSGAVNLHIGELREAIQEKPYYSVAENVNHMAEIMRECDLAISTGGTTVLELATIGVPTIGFSVADDQIAGLRDMDGKGMIRYCGDIRDADLWEKLQAALDTLINEKASREKLSHASTERIDGKGISRICDSILR